VTISSNASNTPEMQVSVRGMIKTIVDASPAYLTLNKNSSGALAGEVTLTTAKTDLAVTEVNFVSNNQGATDWQANLPIPIQFKLTKIEPAKNDTTPRYKLSLSLELDNSDFRYGDFIIKTNHPKKPEIKLGGMLTKTK
jgi:hypothetical protein